MKKKLWEILKGAGKGALVGGTGAVAVGVKDQQVPDPLATLIIMGVGAIAGAVVRKPGDAQRIEQLKEANAELNKRLADQ